MRKTRIAIYILLALGFFSIINQMLLKSLVEDNNKQQILIEEHNLIKAKKEKAQNSSLNTKKEDSQENFRTSRLSIKRSDLPKHEEGWKKYVEKIIEESKILETPQGQAALEKMKIENTEFQGKMQRVEEQIKFFEEQKMAKPLDEQMDKRLETLYKLKALGNILQNKVITEDTFQPEILENLPSQP